MPSDASFFVSFFRAILDRDCARALDADEAGLQQMEQALANDTARLAATAEGARATWEASRREVE
jgi:hypothetical protein